MSEILEKMRKDMFAAVKSHDQETSGIIQMVMASAKNAEIEKGEELSDEEVVEVVRKESKKLQDSIDQFTAGGREDLVKTTQKQKKYVDQYLPQMMSKEEVTKEVKQIIEQLGANSMSDMGKVMGASMGKLKGKVDGAMVKEVVTEQLK